MPDPNTNDNLKEELNIRERLKKLAEDKLRMGAEQTHILEIMNNLEDEILKSDTKKTEKQKELLNIQKKISKQGKDIEEIYKNENTTFDTLKTAYEKFVDLKKDEFNIQKQIGAEEKNKSQRAALYDVLGLKKSIDLIKEFNENLKLSFDTAIFGVFVSLLKDFVGLFQQIDGAASAFRINMGFTRDSTQTLEKNVRAAYFELAQVGVTTKELYESLQGVAGVIGTSRFATIDMAKDMALMSVSLGVAKETSAGFALSMGMMAGATMDSQKNISLFTSKLSLSQFSLNYGLNDK